MSAVVCAPPAGSSWRSGDLAYVLHWIHGTPLDARNVVRGYKALLKRAGLPDRRFHDLRHGAASFMLAVGVPMKQVQRILGHSSFQVTSDTYSHVLPELERDAAERMDAIFAAR